MSEVWYNNYCERVRMCNACSARKECAQPVPGVGNLKARVVFIGRNPGATEDKEGIPFVGKAGVVFNSFLDRCGLKREDVFITNLTLCRTYQNRVQNDREILTCVKLFLLDTIKTIKPELIIMFGRLTNIWLNNIEEVAEANAKLFYHKSLKCFVISSIHPAYVCYTKIKQKDLDKVGDVVINFLRSSHGATI